MTKVSVERLATDVAILLGEGLAEESDVYESPFPRIKDRVLVMAPGLLANLIKEAPRPALTGFVGLDLEVQADSDGMVRIILPDEFLRLYAIKMSDWRRPVTEITCIGDVAADMQTSRWKGIKGTPERPVALEDTDGTGKRCLRLFSSAPAASLSYFFFFKMPKWESDSSIDVPDLLYSELAGRIAEEIRKTGKD